MAQLTNDKKSPRVDMTPMVDLGFLLITFFILTCAFMKPKTIKMLVPAGGGETTVLLKCSKSLTLYLTKTDHVRHFTCPESGVVDSFSFSNTALRQLILKRQKEVIEKWGKDEKLIVVLQVDPKAAYQRLIDAIDAVQITQAEFVLDRVE